MAWLQYVFLSTGIALLAWGYRHRSRNGLLAGALCLFLGGSFAELATRVPVILRVAAQTHQAMEHEHATTAPGGERP